MGARGPMPKPDALRRRQNRPDPVEILPVSVVKPTIPRLPRTYTVELDGVQRTVAFLPESRAWWRSHVHGPMASRLLASDWQRLLLAVRLVDAYYRRPSPSALSEIRHIEAAVGGAYGDRERLGLKVMVRDDKPAGSKPDKSAVLDRYRRASEGGAA